MTTLIGRRYNMHEKLGNGNFGSVYKGKHYKNNNHVAIKLESINSHIKLLQHETIILKYLYEHDTRNIPAIYWYGLHNEYLCLVMTLYDCSLYDYIISKNEIPISKIKSIMYQLIHIIHSVHDNCVIHRDIKPQNIMIKNGDLYLIDFGFSTFYIDSEGEHAENTCSQDIIGSPKYVSYYVHSGYISSRRDDLISIGYLYLFLHEKLLPWENIIDDESINDNYTETSIYHYKNIIRLEMKKLENITNMLTTSDKGLNNYLKYVYSLEYEETPNYDIIEKVFYL